MKLTFSAAAALLAAPLFALSAAAGEPQDETVAEQNETKAKDENKSEEDSAIVSPEVKEEKRICRRISTDMASRRKERVCLTKDEWREFNQRR